MIALVLAASFAGVPGVRVATYPVDGADREAIAASLTANGPIDPHDGTRVAAVTHWRFRWRWPGTAAGGCTLSAASVRFVATVTLPRLESEAPADVAAAWTRYRIALEAHEANHVRHAYAHRGDVRTAIRRATCRTADHAAQAVVARLIAHDLAYDRATRHGAAEGAAFP